MQLIKEIAMANAEEDAMKKIVEEKVSEFDQLIGSRQHEDTELQLETEWPKLPAFIVEEGRKDEVDPKIKPKPIRVVHLTPKSYPSLSFAQEEATRRKFLEELKSRL